MKWVDLVMSDEIDNEASERIGAGRTAAAASSRLEAPWRIGDSSSHHASPLLSSFSIHSTDLESHYIDPTDPTPPSHP